MHLEFRLVPPGLPSVAEHAPGRGCYVNDAGGHLEVFTWDVFAGTCRQVTDRPATGTTTAHLDPWGESVWWFEDDLSGIGRWILQPWAGGPDVEALPGVERGRLAGTAAADDGTTAVALARPCGRSGGSVGDAGLSDGGEAVSVYLRGPRGRVHEVMRAPGLRLVDLSPNGDLMAVTQVDDPGTVRLVDGSGATRTELTCAGPTGRLPSGCRALWPVGFGPLGGEPVLLLVAEWPGEGDAGYRLVTWTGGGGLAALPGGAFDTEIVPEWCPDGRILVRQDRHARSELLVLTPGSGRRERIGPGSGTVLDQRMQPGGDLHCLWTDSRTAPVLRSTSGRCPPGVPAAQGAVEQVSGEQVSGEPVTSTGSRVLRELQERWVRGPGGPVHTLVTLPTSGERPWPAVFLLHGGPHRRDADAYDPMVVVLAAAGLAVVRLNYRGSTGYGAAWRHAADRAAGLCQVEDLLAVRDALVEDGTVDPFRTGVAGRSWGGYLTLLALGVAPRAWGAGAAVQPVGDYAAAHRAAWPEVRALDRGLLGGSPDEVPGEYARCSPSTYAGSVRAPVLLVAMEQDRKCPPEQIRDYARRVRASGTEVSLLDVPGGHDGHDPRAEGRVLAAMATFLARHVGGRAATAATSG